MRKNVFCISFKDGILTVKSGGNLDILRLHPKNENNEQRTGGGKMTISIDSFPADMDNQILKNLKRLGDDSAYLINLMEVKRPCQDIFEQFTKINRSVKIIENLLLANQLKNCFLLNTPYQVELFITLKSLSSKGYGALLVIEREDNLEKVMHKNNFGVLLDAKLSSKLLENIFFPGTPLHDGAVIIREDKVFSAGSVLPLSKQILADKKLGTRHRAALGISELSDAIAIVVSEETKKVSIAMKGELLLMGTLLD